MYTRLANRFSSRPLAHACQRHYAFAFRLSALIFATADTATRKSNEAQRVATLPGLVSLIRQMPRANNLQILDPEATLARFCPIFINS